MFKKMLIFLLIIGIVLVSVMFYVKNQKENEQEMIAEEFSSMNLSTGGVKGLEEKGTKGETIGLIEFETLNIKTEIIEGTDEESLQFGVGHLPYSASVHELGKENHNFALAAKSSLGLDELAVGDYMVIYARNKVLTYQIVEKKMVSREDLSVIEPIEGESVVTIITSSLDSDDEERIVYLSYLTKEKTLDGSEIRNQLKNY